MCQASSRWSFLQARNYKQTKLGKKTDEVAGAGPGGVKKTLERGASAVLEVSPWMSAGYNALIVVPCPSVASHAQERT